MLFNLHKVKYVDLHTALRVIVDAITIDFREKTIPTFVVFPSHVDQKAFSNRSHETCHEQLGANLSSEQVFPKTSNGTLGVYPGPVYAHELRKNMSVNLCMVFER